MISGPGLYVRWTLRTQDPNCCPHTIPPYTISPYNRLPHTVSPCFIPMLYPYALFPGCAHCSQKLEGEPTYGGPTGSQLQGSCLVLGTESTGFDWPHYISIPKYTVCLSVHNPFRHLWTNLLTLRHSLHQVPRGNVQTCFVTDLSY